MKIICKDNFDRESVADALVAENVSEYWGSRIADLLNDKYSGDNSTCFFRCVKNDYKLWRGMEELV